MKEHPPITHAPSDETCWQAFLSRSGTPIVVDYITKPFRAPIVRARVRTHVELKRKSDTLASLALLDGLTGIANRRCFDDTVCLEWRRMARANASLALILIDVDHFKRYNDRYGHLAGDDCLRAVAACLKDSMSRAGDLTARIGGEEFAVLLPDCNTAAGGRAAECLQQAITSLALPHEASPVAPWVTLSMGVAAILPAHGATKHHLLDEADRALYDAKERGRNRVVLAQPPLPSVTSATCVVSPQAGRQR